MTGAQRDLAAGSRIAVVGAGVAGLTSAYLLQRKYDVTLFERNDYAGGHTHTIEIPSGADKGTPVDTGFIVMNDRNYPLLTRLLGKLGVDLRDSDMSFSYWDVASGLQYSGTGLNGLFAQRRNLCRPAFHRMVREIFRFFKSAEEDLTRGALEGLSLGEYLRKGGYSEFFTRHHILPMGAAIWSTPDSRMLAFPAHSFVQFFHNHGLLTLNERPQWKTVTGGSHTYVKRILESFPGEVRLSSPVGRVGREPGGVHLYPQRGGEERFDAIVLAAHADQALSMLEDPSVDEVRLLGEWRYERNATVLHRDSAVMPPVRRAWASWNYTREPGVGSDSPTSVTYDMSRLQGLRASSRYFVSLNRQSEIDAASVVASMVYEHPTYNSEAVATQKELSSISGPKQTYFCGSYHGYGFHEDAVRSAVDICRRLGVDL